MPTKQGPRIEHSKHHSMHLAQVTWGGWEGKERRRRKVREGLGIKGQEDNSGWDGLALPTWQCMARNHPLGADAYVHMKHGFGSAALQGGGNLLTFSNMKYQQ